MAVEKLVKLEDVVKHLHAQQQAAIEETRRLAAIECSEGHLSRAQAISLHDLVRTQESLQADTTDAAKGLRGAGGFQIILTAAAEAMGRAVEGLTRRPRSAHHGGPATGHVAAGDALGSLENRAAEQGNDGNSGGNSDGQGRQRPPGEVLTFAELKLLKLMQLDISERTRALHDRLGSGKPLTEADQREYNGLSEEQGRLGDLLLQMLAPKQPDRDAQPLPEEKP